MLFKIQVEDSVLILLSSYILDEALPPLEGSNTYAKSYSNKSSFPDTL